MRRVGLIVVIALLSVVVATIAVQRRSSVPAVGASGPFIPGLAQLVKGARVVEILGGNTSVKLRLDGDTWVVATSGDYPAQASQLRGLLNELAALELDEALTSRPERLGELELAWPDASNQARLLRILGEDDQPIVEVVLGKERGAPRGQYVRRLAESQAWRVRGAVSVQADGGGFLDRTLLTLPDGEVTEIEYDGLRLKHQSGSAESPAPAGLAAWEPSTEGAVAWSDAQVAEAKAVLPGTLSRLEFEQVRKAQPLPEGCDSLRTITFTTPGAIVRLNLHDEGEEVWMTIQTQPLAAEGAAQPAEAAHEPGEPSVPDWGKLAARVADWEFQLSQWKAAQLKRLRSDEAGPSSLSPSGGTLLPPANAPIIPAPPG